LLTRPDGNVLFYGTIGTDDDLEQIERLGGIARQYLSHRDEIGPGLTVLKKRFGQAIYCHKLDASRPVDTAFEKREVHLGNVELIPTPGHTPGHTCYFVSSPTGRKYLFTGDSIFPQGDGWGTYVPRSQRTTLANSLQLLRDLPVGAVFSSASRSERPVTEMSPGQWAAIVDRVIGTLR
jgi:glyoxylase-like metal-dependent hydrolase (beta-lactamase superfamily II)